MKLKATIFFLWGFVSNEWVEADIYDEFRIFATTSLELKKHKQNEYFCIFMLAFEW